MKYAFENIQVLNYFYFYVSTLTNYLWFILEFKGVYTLFKSPVLPVLLGNTLIQFNIPIQTKRARRSVSVSVYAYEFHKLYISLNLLPMPNCIFSDCKFDQ